ncbi:hypothetical protein HaLaN_02785, partial [Haematococcus lacustris]
MTFTCSPRSRLCCAPSPALPCWVWPSKTSADPSRGMLGRGLDVDWLLPAQLRLNNRGSTSINELELSSADTGPEVRVRTCRLLHSSISSMQVPAWLLQAWPSCSSKQAAQLFLSESSEDGYDYVEPCVLIEDPALLQPMTCSSLAGSNVSSDALFDSRPSSRSATSGEDDILLGSAPGEPCCWWPSGCGSSNSSASAGMPLPSAALPPLSALQNLSKHPWSGAHPLASVSSASLRVPTSTSAANNARWDVPSAAVTKPGIMLDLRTAHPTTALGPCEAASPGASKRRRMMQLSDHAGQTAEPSHPVRKGSNVMPRTQLLRGASVNSQDTILPFESRCWQHMHTRKLFAGVPEATKSAATPVIPGCHNCGWSFGHASMAVWPQWPTHAVQCVRSAVQKGPVSGVFVNRPTNAAMACPSGLQCCCPAGGEA